MSKLRITAAGMLEAEGKMDPHGIFPEGTQWELEGWVNELILEPYGGAKIRWVDVNDDRAGLEATLRLRGPAITVALMRKLRDAPDGAIKVLAELTADEAGIPRCTSMELI